MREKSALEKRPHWRESSTLEGTPWWERFDGSRLALMEPFLVFYNSVAQRLGESGERLDAPHLSIFHLGDSAVMGESGALVGYSLCARELRPRQRLGGLENRLSESVLV